MITALKPPKSDNLRPTSLEDYVGQEPIKDLLWTSIHAAKARGEPLDHVLLNGPPGLGKTTLAMIIANEMGWGNKTIISPSIGTPRAVVELLMGLPPKTQLFIDEIHRMRRPVQEVFYPVLEDGRLYSTLADVELKINPITIVGATTAIGQLEQPFIDRFGLQFQLEYYTEDELSEILMASGEKLKMIINWPIADAVAKRSRGTPRIANMFLKRLRDYAEVGMKSITPDFAAQIIEKKLHTDALGLRTIDIRYLKALVNEENGIGVDAVATKIHEDVDTVQDFIEPYLIKLGFIERRRNGRWLTDEGKKYVGGKNA